MAGVLNQVCITDTSEKLEENGSSVSTSGAKSEVLDVEVGCS
jgi:hypothetical protein